MDEGTRIRLSAAKYCDAVVEREVGCFWCALSMGHPYAVAYELLRDPEYYEKVKARGLAAEARVQQANWHDIKEVQGTSGPYMRYECYWPDGYYHASGPMREDRICFNCKQVI